MQIFGKGYRKFGHGNDIGPGSKLWRFKAANLYRAGWVYPPNLQGTLWVKWWCCGVYVMDMDMPYAKQGCGTGVCERNFGTHDCKPRVTLHTDPEIQRVHH